MQVNDQDEEALEIGETQNQREKADAAGVARNGQEDTISFSDDVVFENENLSIFNQNQRQGQMLNTLEPDFGGSKTGYKTAVKTKTIDVNKFKYRYRRNLDMTANPKKTTPESTIDDCTTVNTLNPGQFNMLIIPNNRSDSKQQPNGRQAQTHRAPLPDAQAGQPSAKSATKVAPLSPDLIN